MSSRTLSMSYLSVVTYEYSYKIQSVTVEAITSTSSCHSEVVIINTTCTTYIVCDAAVRYKNLWKLFLQRSDSLPASNLGTFKSILLCCCLSVKT